MLRKGGGLLQIAAWSGGVSMTFDRALQVDSSSEWGCTTIALIYLFLMQPTERLIFSHSHGQARQGLKFISFSPIQTIRNEG